MTDAEIDALMEQQYADLESVRRLRSQIERIEWKMAERAAALDREADRAMVELADTIRALK